MNHRRIQLPGIASVNSERCLKAGRTRTFGVSQREWEVVGILNGYIITIYIYVFSLQSIFTYIYMIYTPRVGNRKQGQSKEQMGYCIYGTIAIAFQMLVSSLNPFTLPRSMVVTLNSWINPDATKTANFVLYRES